jgi:hypothetical protein
MRLPESQKILHGGGRGKAEIYGCDDEARAESDVESKAVVRSLEASDFGACATEDARLQGLKPLSLLGRAAGLKPRPSWSLILDVPCCRSSLGACHWIRRRDES